jgi:purine-cytosine permease-like protein
LKTKIKLMFALIATVIFAVYGIELGIRVLTADGKIEYFVVVLVIIVLLLFFDSRFYSNYKTEKRI